MDRTSFTYCRLANSWRVSLGRLANSWGVSPGRLANSWGVSPGRLANSWGISPRRLANSWRVSPGRLAAVGISRGDNEFHQNVRPLADHVKKSQEAVPSSLACAITPFLN